MSREHKDTCATADKPQVGWSAHGWLGIYCSVSLMLGNKTHGFFNFK